MNLEETYAFRGTVFPYGQTIPEAHIKLLDSFMSNVDAVVNVSPSASETFRELFTRAGIWKTPSAKFEGHEELAKSGDLWPYFKTLGFFQHRILEVYGNDEEGKRVMLLGRIQLDKKTGEHEEFDFSARVEFDTSGAAGPRIAFFQGWSSRV